MKITFDDEKERYGERAELKIFNKEIFLKTYKFLEEELKKDRKKRFEEMEKYRIKAFTNEFKKGSNKAVVVEKKKSRI